MRLGLNQKIVLGPPGCGKTTELLRLLETHLEEGTSPERVAYFSFTKKAVEVARERAVERFDFHRDQMQYFRTLHSMVFALNGHQRSDVLGKPHYTEISAALGISFLGASVDETTGLMLGGGEGDQHLFLDALRRARLVPLLQQWHEAELPDLDFRAVERTVAAVDLYKKANGLVDFTDMLEIYLDKGAPLDIDVAFVDEAQDLSALQWRVLWLMLANCPRVYIAGDDDQAIYRWSGADVKEFLALEGEKEVLHQSWRCPTTVHDTACRISSKIVRRLEKPWNARPFAGAVHRIHSLDGFDFTKLEGSTLLLARNTHLLKEYTDQLKKRGLSYLTQHGAPSVRPAHAKAIYAYTRLTRGKKISGAEARFIYEQLRVGIGVIRGFKSLPGLDSKAEVDEPTLRSKYGLLATGPWYDAVDGIPGSDRLYYRGILRQGGDLLATPSIQVNTIHGVKGGEAENVVVNPDMAQRSYRAYQKAADDEHRVAYVAVSRARKNLFLVSPRTNNFYPY